MLFFIPVPQDQRNCGFDDEKQGESKNGETGDNGNHIFVYSINTAQKLQRQERQGKQDEIAPVGAAVVLFAEKRKERQQQKRSHIIQTESRVEQQNQDGGKHDFPTLPANKAGNENQRHKGIKRPSGNGICQGNSRITAPRKPIQGVAIIQKPSVVPERVFLKGNADIPEIQGK